MGGITKHGNADKNIINEVEKMLEKQKMKIYQELNDAIRF